jgi:hypothetical protein
MPEGVARRTREQGRADVNFAASDYWSLEHVGSVAVTVGEERRG